MQIEKMPGIAFSKHVPVLFGLDDTSLVMIGKGTYSHVEEALLDRRNLLQAPVGRRSHLEILGFDGPLTATDAIRLLRRFDKRPARVEHILAVGYQYPKILSEVLPFAGADLLTIIALGGSVRTCVVDFDVFIGLSNHTGFGKGKHLIGHHTKPDNRQFGTDFLFLTIDDSRRNSQYLTTPFRRP